MVPQYCSQASVEHVSDMNDPLHGPRPGDIEQEKSCRKQNLLLCELIESN